MMKVFCVLIIFISPELFGQPSVKKCDETILIFTSEKLGVLTRPEIKDFLLTFGKECQNNVEFSEWSNELLFLVLEKQTELFLKTFKTNKREIELNEILDDLSSPVNDQININDLILKMSMVKHNSRMKERIMGSLKLAQAKF